MLLKKENTIKYIPGKTNVKKNHAIILVHGLIRSHHSMKHLGKHLSAQGYDIYLYQYQSTQLNIATHCSNFKHALYRISNRFSSGKTGTISIITHSLGGIIARQTLSELNEDKLQLFSNLILLTPPNKGSALANLITRMLPFMKKLIKPLAELSNHTSSYIHQVKTPADIKIGIIAAKYDHAAPASTSQLKEQNDFTVIKTGHSFIMNNTKARQQILFFLQHGAFCSA
jgi:esterase/lipase